MNDLFSIYIKYFTPALILAVASNPAVPGGIAANGDELPVKIKIKPVNVKGSCMFQVTRTVGAKEFHENMTAEEAAGLLAASATFEDTSVSQHFKQIEIKSSSTSVVSLVSKKGKVTTKEHGAAPTGSRAEVSERSAGTSANKSVPIGNRAATQGNRITASAPAFDGADSCEIFAHNKKKNYVLPEGEPVPFLVELGVMTKEGAVVKSRYDKFRQINRYLEFVEDVLPSLPQKREISIIDFGCGKSYLTFALYYYLHEKQGYDVRITGLDLKRDVIEHCNALASRFGYEKLEFLHGDIADYTGTDSVDMVVTLHACDTATDYALYKAISWGAKVIFCVPCCQHELNYVIHNEELEPVLKYGLIKERMSALITDALRANMLEEQGYKTQVLEFIDMEHTPKNILIRAVKKPKQMLPKAAAGQQYDYDKLMESLGADLTLHRLLKNQQKQ